MWRNVSIWHVLVIVIALVVVIGWKRLPDMARSVGQSLRIFKSEVEQMTDKDKGKDSAVSDQQAPGQQGPGQPDHGQRVEGTPPPVVQEPPSEATRRTDGPGPGA